MAKTFHIKACVVEVELGPLLKLEKAVQERAHALLDKMAFDIEETAKTLAKVDTGAMRSSIYVSGASKGGGSGYSAAVAEAKGRAASRGKTVEFHDEIRPSSPFERIIAPSVKYGIYPELNGQPYIGPAVETHRANFIKGWGEILKA
jgi:hypothetical protein